MSVVVRGLLKVLRLTDEGRLMMVVFRNLQNMKHMVSVIFGLGELRLIVAAGYTYCAIAALSFLGRLPNSDESELKGQPGLTNVAETTRWLVSRQMGYQAEVEDSDDESEATKDDPESTELAVEAEDFVGFNGRCNKMVDTCYAFWVGASLDVSLLKGCAKYNAKYSDAGPRRIRARKCAFSTSILVRANTTPNRRIWQVSWESSR